MITPRRIPAVFSAVPPAPTARRLRSRARAWCLALVRLALVATLTLASSGKLRAADVTWNNGSASFLWNLTDLNWSTGAWNNANGDGAIFGATGAGAINVTSADQRQQPELHRQWLHARRRGLAHLRDRQQHARHRLHQRADWRHRHDQHRDQQLVRPVQAWRRHTPTRRPDHLQRPGFPIDGSRYAPDRLLRWRRKRASAAFPAARSGS